MPNIGQIKNQVEFYLQTTSFSQDGQDILLDELNNARREAENQFDWERSLQRTTLSVDPDTGGDLTSVSLSDSHTFKTIQTVFLVDDNGDVPLHFSTKRRTAMRKRNELDSFRWDYETEYRTDSERDRSLQRAPQAYQQGLKLYLDPKPTAAKTVALDVFTWWPDYTADSDTDFFTEYGATYLKWAAIVALNMHTGTFAPRQEGTLPPPERMRDDALARLRSLDLSVTHVGRSPSL